MRLSALVLALILALSFGSYAESSDGIVALVNQEPIQLSELLQRAKPQIASLDVFATSASATEKKAQRDVLYAKVLEEMIFERIALQKAVEKGIVVDAAIKEDASQKYTHLLKQTEEYARRHNPEAKDEAFDALVDTLLHSSGNTREELKKSTLQGALLDALYKKVQQEVGSIPERDVYAYYENLHQAQIKAFDADVQVMEQYLLRDQLVLYRPVRCKLIKKAEWNIDSKVMRIIRTLRSVGSHREAEQIWDEQIALLQQQAEAILDKVHRGEKTFDGMMEELAPGSSQRVNYFTEQSKRFDEQYRQRVGAFTALGEVSCPYVTPNGLAVLYYAGDLPTVEKVPYNEVREKLERDLLEEAGKAHLAAQKEIWKKEAVVIRYLELLP